MKPSPSHARGIIALAAAVCLAPALGRAPADASAAGTAALADTVLELPTGDRIRVTIRSLGTDGIDVCAAVGGPQVRRGKTLYASNNARTPGVGMATTVRFPSMGRTATCERHRQTEGDSITFLFVKQLADPLRVGRVTAGAYTLPLAEVRRKRITFRWDRDGGDAPLEPEGAR